jgi:hypothetical protein
LSSFSFCIEVFVSSVTEFGVDDGEFRLDKDESMCDEGCGG